jgi:hypothetical protein
MDLFTLQSEMHCALRPRLNYVLVKTADVNGIFRLDASSVGDAVRHIRRHPDRQAPARHSGTA